MENSSFGEIPKFKTAEEELQYLRSRVYEKQGGQSENKEKVERSPIAKQTLDEYKVHTADTVLSKELQLSDAAADQIVLNLSPEEHDIKMAELLDILQERGVKNALKVVDRLNDPHIDDDFHRFLVQYIKKGLPTKGIKEKTTLHRALHMKLFEISLPATDATTEVDQKKSLAELVASMEQFYAGMLSVAQDKNSKSYIGLEIANSHGSEESIFYVSIPEESTDLFEKQVLAVFHTAKIREVPDDYNIFNEQGVSVAAYATLTKKALLPLKTYDELEFDPLNIVLNSFSKLKKVGEGAAIQVLLQPAGDQYHKKFQSNLDKLKKGGSLKDILKAPETFMQQIKFDLKESIKDLFKSSKKKTEEEEKKKNDKNKPVDDEAVELVTKKLSTQIVSVNIRIIASATDEVTATRILSEIEATFNQLENTRGNKLQFNRVKKGKLHDVLHNYAYRIFDSHDAIPLNLEEISSFMHFQTSGLHASPTLKQAKAGSAPAPIGMPTDGTLLGVNRHRNVETMAYMAAEDRLRHMYVIGQTGTGKSTLLKNMVIQDIIAGNGVCMIDPHGVDIVDVLSAVPKERYEDIIYFDPSYTARPMALNMLEFDRNYPEQKTFVVNEMLSIFNKLFDMKVAGGPMFEQYFRNAVLLVLEDPEEGATLLDISKVLANKAYRELKLSRCKNPVVVQFWREVADKAGGEASLANIVPYITSKFDVFLSNDIMRPIIAQEHSSFNFRDIMDNKKILLVNLAKGRLGDINANLIGLILVGKILMAALSRVDSMHKDLPPFYLYIDEFQNVTTDSIATILSEARKYKLSLTVAHQFIAQLEEKIRDAVFGNVGSVVSFRVGAEDAEFLEKQFTPVFTAYDIMNLDNRNAYLKLLIHGKLVKPFNIETLAPPQTNKEHTDKLKELSYLKFGRDRLEIEADIARLYEKKPAPVV